MKVRLMKQLIVILLLFAASISTAACVELKAGNVNIDFGDGYKASFTLPNTVSAYDIKTDTQYHVVSVNAADNEDTFLEIQLTVASQSYPHSIPAAGRSDSGLTYLPRSIDGATGCVIYAYPENNPGTNPDEANGAVFKYYPGATAPKATADGIEVEGIYEVYADTLGSSGPTTISVFDSILNSIHVTGV
jgi:hypothetical protein